MEFITVQGVNKKSKYPKFNSGAVITDKDEWINVAKKVDINLFENGGTYEVEIPEGKYKTIVDVKLSDEVEKNSSTKKEDKKESFTPPKLKHEDKKDKAMSLGGLMHDAAALAAPNAVGKSNLEILADYATILDQLMEIKENRITKAQVGE